MKQKTISIIVIIASVVSVCTSLLHIISNIMIPALAPFSLMVAMLGIVLIAKLNFNQGKSTKKYYIFMLCVGTIAVITNLIAGVLQIIAII